MVPINFQRGDLNSSTEPVASQNRPSRTRGVPFVAKAAITTSCGHVISCLTQEISRFGVYFLHRGAIERGEITLQFEDVGPDQPYYLSLEGSRALGDDWFLSQAEFPAPKFTGTDATIDA